MKNVDEYELNQDNHDLKYEAYARRESSQRANFCSAA